MSFRISDRAFADMQALVELVNGNWVGAPAKLAAIFRLGKRLAPELRRATRDMTADSAKGGKAA